MAVALGSSFIPICARTTQPLMWKLKRPYEKVLEKMQSGSTPKQGPTVTKEGYRTGKANPLVRTARDYTKDLIMDQSGAAKKDGFLRSRGFNSVPGKGIHQESRTGLAQEKSAPVIPDFKHPGTSRAPQ